MLPGRGPTAFEKESQGTLGTGHWLGTKTTRWCTNPRERLVPRHVELFGGNARTGGKKKKRKLVGMADARGGKERAGGRGKNKNKKDTTRRPSC